MGSLSFVDLMQSICILLLAVGLILNAYTNHKISERVTHIARYIWPFAPWDDEKEEEPQHERHDS